MRYLKLFEENKENIESFFKDKIDWKLVNYITDIGTKYEDKEFAVRIRIVISDPRYKKLFEHSSYWLIWANNYNNRSDAYINDLIKSYNKYGLFYLFSVCGKYVLDIEENDNLSIKELEKIRHSKEYLNSLNSGKEYQKIMMNKIKDKFNVIELEKITGEEIFKLK